MNEFVYLLIAEHLDLPDIFSLACTNKHAYQLFVKHHRVPYLIEYRLNQHLLASQYKNFVNEIWTKLRKNNTILTGSFLLSIIHSWPINLSYQDIDLYTRATKQNDCFTISQLADTFYNIRVENAGNDLYERGEIDFGDNSEELTKEQIREIIINTVYQKVYLGISELAENVGIDNRRGQPEVEKMLDYLKTNGLMDIYYDGGLDNIRIPFGNPLQDKIPYYQSEASKYLHSIREYNLEQTKLQIIETRTHPKKCVELFDFDFCQVYYDFSNKQIVSLKGEVDLKTHSGPIQNNRTSEGRKEKYVTRGYLFIE